MSSQGGTQGGTLQDVTTHREVGLEHLVVPVLLLAVLLASSLLCAVLEVGRKYLRHLIVRHCVKWRISKFSLLLIFSKRISFFPSVVAQGLSRLQVIKMCQV